MSKPMTAAVLRRKYIDFFKRHGHAEIKSAPLVPENDPTCLFTTAGMPSSVPFLLGEKHPAGKRLTNVQKCFVLAISTKSAIRSTRPSSKCSAIGL